MNAVVLASVDSASDLADSQARAGSVGMGVAAAAGGGRGGARMAATDSGRRCPLMFLTAQAAAAKVGKKARVLIRINPDVDPQVRPA